MAKAPSNSDNVQRVAVVPDPNAATAGAAGLALTEGQRAGIDPIDPEANAEQAQDRSDLINMQTDHERENALDPLSRGPNVAVTESTPLTAKQQGAPVTDMSGRPAMPAASYADLVPMVRDKLRDAIKADKDLAPEQRGFRNPLELGVPKATLDEMVADGAPIETALVPNGHFFPDTGTRYRMKGKSSS